MNTRATALGFCLILLSFTAIGRTNGPALHAPGKHDTGHTISLEADVTCTPKRAFELWSTSAGVESFFAPKAKIDSRVGGHYTVVFFPKDDPEGLTHGTAGAHVLLKKPNRLYAFEWVVFAGDQLKGSHAPPYAPATTRMPDPLPTWVELRFEPATTGTHVWFHHYGFGDGPLWAESQAWFTTAWSGVLTGMKNTCRASPLLK